MKAHTYALKLEFLSLLRIAREKYTLKQLSEILNIDIPTLSKYANYQLVPSVKRINELMPKLLQIIDPIEELKQALLQKGFNFPELNNVVNHNPHTLHYASIRLFYEALKAEFNKILTVEGGGLIIASTISLLTGKKMVYAIRGIPSTDAISEEYIPLEVSRYPPKYKMYISIPRGSISRNDAVIIVDDISWTGGTVLTLYKLAVKQKASVKGVYLLAIYRDTYNKLREAINIPITSLMVLE